MIHNGSFFDGSEEKMFYKKEGITLIALVITIIVMLILAAVTIRTAVSGGLFQQAQNAAEATKQVAENEQAQINDVIDQINQDANVENDNTGAAGSFNYIMAIPSDNLTYTIDLPIGSFSYDFSVDWGDETTSTVASQADVNKTHTYTAAGNYTVKITGIAQGGIRFTSETRLSQLLTPYPNSMNITQTDFSSFFDGCTGLTGPIPTGLFDFTPNITTFERTFGGCSNITGSIPAGLFNKTTKVTTFRQTFTGCRKITAIPSGLFDYTLDVTSFNNTFNSCQRLNEYSSRII